MRSIPCLLCLKSSRFLLLPCKVWSLVSESHNRGRMHSSSFWQETLPVSGWDTSGSLKDLPFPLLPVHASPGSLRRTPQRLENPPVKPNSPSWLAPARVEVHLVKWLLSLSSLDLPLTYITRLATHITTSYHYLTSNPYPASARLESQRPGIHFYCKNTPLLFPLSRFF